MFWIHLPWLWAVVGWQLTILGMARHVSAFSSNLLHLQQRQPRTIPLRAADAPDDIGPNPEELAYLKKELLAYLEKRKELGADEAAKETVGKVIGGTKGNKILEYVSGAPNKAKVAEEPPNPLDYDELTKYGYGNLVTPIMKNGGRLKMYELLELDLPAVRKKKVVKSAPPLKIDRMGEETRYQGLRLGQILDDEQQGMALKDVQEKLQKGERPSASKVREEVESFEKPFADRRNVGPRQTPDWTPERLDEWGKMQGRVEAWARASKEGAFVKDPLEKLDSLNASQRFFSVVTAVTFAVAFGRSTPTFLSMLAAATDATTTVDSLDVLQIPALALVLASVGSCAFCTFTASSKKRSSFVWGVKGLLGGPLTVRQLVGLSTLLTQKEQDDADRATELLQDSS